MAERELAGLVNGVNQTGASHQDLFMSAASPGIIALTLGNAHYATHEKYVMALAEEMRKEYELITAAGVVLHCALLNRVIIPATFWADTAGERERD